MNIRKSKERIAKLQHLKDKASTLAALYPEAFEELQQELTKPFPETVKICKKHDVPVNNMYGLIEAAKSLKTINI